MPRDYQALTELAARIAAGMDTRAARMKAVTDVLWDGLKDEAVSWCGFYVPTEDASKMVLEVCRDKPACSPIGLHGVCGQAFLSGEVQVVHDVKDLGDAYVACDPSDRSELVVPLVDAGGKCWAVLDLDSFETGAFAADDAEGLKRVLAAAGLV
ncbi:MAG: GAF domain-containing protein [Acidobacteriota bacterium]|jgi:putative methionine-R-sulfoxide reductase with GAF domain